MIRRPGRGARPSPTDDPDAPADTVALPIPGPVAAGALMLALTAPGQTAGVSVCAAGGGGADPLRRGDCRAGEPLPQTPADLRRAAVWWAVRW
jgi:hypothetical protein